MPPKQSQKHLFFIAKYLNSLVLGITVVILCVLVYFLYNNFYLTIAEAKQLNSLQEKVVSENLQKGRFNQVLEGLQAKSGALTVASSVSSTTSTMPTSTEASVPAATSTETVAETAANSSAVGTTTGTSTAP